MGLMKSLRNFLRGEADKISKKLEDPVRDGNFAIEDAKGDIRKFEANIKDAITHRNRLKAQHAEAAGEAKKYGKLAEAAASRDEPNMDDVTTLLGKKTAAAQQASMFGKELQNIDASIDQMKAQLNKARTKVSKAEANKGILDARMHAADVRKKMSAAYQSMNEGEGLAALDKLEEQVQTAEAEASAHEELSGDDVDDLEAKYGSDTSEASDEAAALVAKMKKKKKK
jgi:phage shock protein A